LLPRDRSLVDYYPLLDRSLAAIAETEDRPVGDLLVEIAHRQALIVRLGVEVEAHPDGGIPIRLASAMLAALVDTASAAAAQLWSTRRTDAPWANRIGDGYLERVRLEHTEPGSFVMKGVLPEDHRNPPLVTSAALTKVLDTTLRSLNTQYAGDHLFPPPTPSDVLSASLLASLSRLRRQEAIPVWWALARLGPRRERQLLSRFEQPALDHIAATWPEEAGQVPYEDELGEAAMAESLPPPLAREVEDVTLTGNVVQLSRPAVVLRVEFENRPARVRIASLTPEQYDQALRAHEHESPIQVRGALVVRGKSLRMRTVEELRLF
jgi:hypothetical protein